MAETSDGMWPPNNNNSNSERCKNCNNPKRNPRESKFKGECTELKGSLVYDIIAGKDTFLKTTQKIAEYISRTFNDADEFCIGMVDLQLPVLTPPLQPANATNAFKVELWKMAQHEHNDKTQSQQKNSGRVVALVLGQCSQALCNCLEADADWETVNGTSDAIGLLEYCPTSSDMLANFFLQNPCKVALSSSSELWSLTCQAMFLYPS